jgi:hypothetical protein
VQKAATGAECLFASRRPQGEVSHPWQLLQADLGERTQSMGRSLHQGTEDVRLCQLEIAPNLFFRAPSFFLDVR